MTHHAAPKEKAKNFLAEFKEFALKGSVVDLAVGVIIGAAFKSITDSLVNDILMPFIGIFVGQASFSNLYFTINHAKIGYGSFISNVINFFLIAFIIFLMVKGINALRSMGERHKEEETTAESHFCPYCKSEIAEGAVRCPHCTSKLPGFPGEEPDEPNLL